MNLPFKRHRSVVPAARQATAGIPPMLVEPSLVEEVAEALAACRSCRMPNDTGEVGSFELHTALDSINRGNCYRRDPETEAWRKEYEAADSDLLVA